MEEYQQRVMDEKKALDEKLERLDDFLRDLTFTTLPSIGQSLLIQQRVAMGSYSNILSIRILNF